MTLLFAGYKIMMLQESKKQLATELIGTESGFLKSLSRDDILMLFS
jgi:SNF2 family DNA or RNA helicase